MITDYLPRTVFLFILGQIGEHSGCQISMLFKKNGFSDPNHGIAEVPLLGCFQLGGAHMTHALAGVTKGVRI